MPAISVVMALKVDGDPCAQIIRSLPWHISESASPLGDQHLVNKTCLGSKAGSFTVGMTFLRLPKQPPLGQT